MRQGLFKDEPRTCCCCGAEQLARAPYQPNADRIIAITPVLYWRGSGKGQLKNAVKIFVCENCIARAATSPSGSEVKKLGRFFLDSLIDCYSKLQRRDA
jgi:hypothetical protein